MLWRLRGREYTFIVGRERGRIAARGYATSALDTTAVLFAQRALLHRAKGMYVAPGLRADMKVRQLVWMFQGQSEFCGKPAHVVKCEIGGRMLTIGFSKSSRELYGYSAKDKTGTVWALKKGLLPPN